MADKIKVYYINANGVYQGHFRLEDPGYQAKAGETTVPKPSLREPAVLEGGTWRGATDEEYAAWLATQPKKEEQPKKPSAEQQMINRLGKTQMTQASKIDTNTADIKQVKQMINFIGKQQLTKTTTENGGN